MSTFRSLSDRARAIAELAYQFWEERGCPEGSSEEDWYKAELIIDGEQYPEKHFRELHERQPEKKTRRDNQA